MNYLTGQDLWQWRREAQAKAAAVGIPKSEVDWLLEVAGLDRLSLRLETFRERPAIALSLSLIQLSQLWQRRLEERSPVQYLAGVAHWRHFTLTVSPDVLIPRPETELLIDLAVAAATPELAGGDWVDLGTGSGAIALGLAEAFPKATIHAVDRSEKALAIAQKNAETLGFTNRIHFYQGDWWEPLAALKGQVSGMVSNPPYIPSAEVFQLQPEVTNHEPHLALDGGIDGLDCIRHLVQTAPDYLKPAGLWMIEMMAGQAPAVKLLLEQSSYNQIQIVSDLAGIERFAIGASPPRFAIARNNSKNSLSP